MQISFMRVYADAVSCRIDSGACILLVLLLAMGLTAGCGRRNDEGQPRADITLPKAGVVLVGVEDGRRIIAHPFGVAHVPIQPKRIVSLGMADPLTLLGEKPIAQSLFFGAFRDYLRPHLQGVQPIGTVYGSFQPNIESVYAAKPDLILATPYSGLSYDQLSRIAPTVIITYQRHPSDWQYTLDWLHQVAVVLGKEQQAKQIESAFRAKAERARQILHDHPSSQQTIATFRIHVRRYRVNGRSQGGGPILYNLLGLQPPEVIRENHWAKRAPILFLTEEKLLHLDVGHLFVIVDPTPGSHAVMNQLAKREAWRRLPAVRNNHVYHVSTGSWQGGGLLGQEQVIDDIVMHMTGQTLPKLMEVDRTR